MLPPNLPCDGGRTRRHDAVGMADGHDLPTPFEVRLTYAADGPVSLAVSDNGIGFEPGAEARGYGLDGATARAAEVGGHFDVDSTPGEGSRLRVEVPR